MSKWWIQAERDEGRGGHRKKGGRTLDRCTKRINIPPSGARDGLRRGNALETEERPRLDNVGEGVGEGVGDEGDL